jgi:GMP synthase (glutamine-hydrolysing)
MILIINNTQGAKGSYYPEVLRYFRSRDIPHMILDSLAGLHRVDRSKVRGILLTGSPLMVNATDMDAHPEQFLLNIRAIEDFGVPVIGICFGCQLLNQLYGGELKRLGSLFCKDAELKWDRDPVDARFCLRYMISKAAPAFHVVATATIRGHTVPCFIKHKKLPLWGCLFHPEYHTATHGILDEFLQMC